MLRPRRGRATRPVPWSWRVIVPEATTTPITLIDHGYDADTVASAPCAQLDVTVTPRFAWFRFAAEFLTALTVAVVASGVQPRTTDGGLARAGAGGVRQRHPVVVDDAELHDPHQDEEEDRGDDGELGHRLAPLRSESDSWLAHLGVVPAGVLASRLGWPVEGNLTVRSGRA